VDGHGLTSVWLHDHVECSSPRLGKRRPLPAARRSGESPQDVWLPLRFGLFRPNLWASPLLPWAVRPDAPDLWSWVPHALQLAGPAAIRTRRGSARGRSSTAASPHRRRPASASRAGPAGSPGQTQGPAGDQTVGADRMQPTGGHLDDLTGPVPRRDPVGAHGPSRPVAAHAESLTGLVRPEAPATPESAACPAR
jgi:hypothetical protein